MFTNRTMRSCTSNLAIGLAALATSVWAEPAAPGRATEEQVLRLDSRRELFVDHFLIDRLDKTRLVLHRPKDEGIVVAFDKPWEGLFCAYTTILKDGDRYRLYYRGLSGAGKDDKDEHDKEVTCTAESTDGIHWTKPNLGLFEVEGTRENNVILANAAPLCHNFSPLIDARPGIPEQERFKALAGTDGTGLVALVSADGLRWRKLRDEAVIRQGALDSQNVAFWSPSEECYVCYFRTLLNGIRWVARSTSKDFVHWTPLVQMEFHRPGGLAPSEHLYTNQTHPYFRVPHLYVATAARFVPGRQVITNQQAKAINVHPALFKDVSDGVLMTSRGGNRYDRTFMEGFLRPGIGPENWVSRTNYPVLNVVQTGPCEMSLYMNANYGQPTACLRRYTLRLDGFASVQAAYDGGQMVTKCFTFTGKRLSLNFATSAAGGIRVVIEDAAGKPIPGYTLDEATELIGNEIDRSASWKAGTDVNSLAGRPIRLRFVMKDADLYSLQFVP